MKIEGENDCEKVIEDLLIALKGVSVAFTIREKSSFFFFFICYIYFLHFLHESTK